MTNFIALSCFYPKSRVNEVAKVYEHNSEKNAFKVWYDF